MIFPVVMYGYKIWAMKKAEHQWIDALNCGFWRRLLRVPWAARRSNLSILKEISPQYPLEGLMLKWKLQHFDHLMQRTDSWKRPWCWERLNAGGEGGNRGWNGWMASPARWTWVWVGSGSSWWTGKPGILKWGRKVRGDWAELDWSWNTGTIPSPLTENSNLPYPMAIQGPHLKPPMVILIQLKTFLCYSLPPSW